MQLLSLWIGTKSGGMQHIGTTAVVQFSYDRFCCYFTHILYTHIDFWGFGANMKKYLNENANKKSVLIAGPDLSFFPPRMKSTFNRTVPSGIKPSRDDHRRHYLRLLPGIFGNLARATGEVTTWERLRYLQLPRGPDCLTTAPPETWKLRFLWQMKNEKPWT